LRSFSLENCLISIKYYSKAIASPLGQQVRDFYTSTSKQILDIHEEASRIASQQKDKAASDAAKVSQPVELKANTAVSENPATVPDAAAVSGNPASASDAT
jgi:hypothetical protein